ncbi:unnamed protein product [Adineta ricciae]|uniref:RanBP2-type domain-containing protein n=1 Tax=Adineta ricciae TaxID=249248 RepID=A0A816DWQ4_ADIRI|nr:unnamed protein product [Adineta ricciae]
MGGKLSVHNDCLENFDIQQISIFTPGQGILLQRLEPKNHRKFKFDQDLAYGSWYDIQIIGFPKEPQLKEEKPTRYLVKGIYLSSGKIVKISELIDEENLDLAGSWHCGSCNEENFGSVAICEFCFTNKAHKIISGLSYIPVLGIPFSVTNAVLQCGKAARSNTNGDTTDAVVSTTFAVIDVVTAPLIVGSFVTKAAETAAQAGVKLTTKTVLREGAKPILTAGVEAATTAVIINAKKAELESLIRNRSDN